LWVGVEELMVVKRKNFDSCISKEKWDELNLILTHPNFKGHTHKRITLIGKPNFSSISRIVGVTRKTVAAYWDKNAYEKRRITALQYKPRYVDYVKDRRKTTQVKEMTSKQRKKHRLENEMQQ
jgi:hypothetical protein